MNTFAKTNASLELTPLGAASPYRSTITVMEDRTNFNATINVDIANNKEPSKAMNAFAT